MPQLPTVDVTQAQADRILQAFAAKYGTTTTADTVIAYKKELIARIMDSVNAYEQQKYFSEQQARKQTEIADMLTYAGL